MSEKREVAMSWGKISIFLLAWSMFSFSHVFAGAGGEKGQGISAMLQSFPEQQVDAGEQSGLQMMYEEEKLARDVYLEMNRLWNLNIFQNISQSEQQHMNSVELLLKRYRIPYEGDKSAGEYSSTEMSELYAKLTKQGAQSVTAALLVGATVEDLDIKDLYSLLEQTDNSDIAFVYRNLAKGSRNHLRSFTAQLRSLGVSYNAQYLTEEQLNQVVNSPHERGMMK
jgi:hypothetical protein